MQTTYITNYMRDQTRLKEKKLNAQRKPTVFQILKRILKVSYHFPIFLQLLDILKN